MFACPIALFRIGFVNRSCIRLMHFSLVKLACKMFFIYICIVISSTSKRKSMEDDSIRANAFCKWKSDNGDGTFSSLSSKKAKCSILFAVYVTRDKKSVYGMNFEKKGLTLDKDCDISSCPVASTEKPTLSLLTFRQPSSSSKITLATKLSGVISGPKNEKITPENTKITPSSWPSGKIVEKTGSTKPANDITGSSTESWLTTTVFISATAFAFVFGIIVVAIILACKKALQKKDRFHFV
ncbi:uncharacterized protein LOC124454003 [Xenia sp. Carnegie-2017]|uniref:uncharacterized protein LOC124454003 n=1 Tax=Xenia sp. Carnegie-2017 TaxID=2897299 RepID=UPI001F04A863|nr:uncharacterized protein LOC124454003 [Xenia sp. Carnegie-2017]